MKIHSTSNLYGALIMSCYVKSQGIISNCAYCRHQLQSVSEFNSLCLLDCIFVKAKKKKKNAISVKVETNHVCFDTAGDINTVGSLRLTGRWICPQCAVTNMGWVTPCDAARLDAIFCKSDKQRQGTLYAVKENNLFYLKYRCSRSSFPIEVCCFSMFIIR